MYNNIGNALKSFAIAAFVIILIFSIILGIIFINESLLMCVIIIAAGIFVATSASMLLHGFGELIIKAQEIERNTRKSDSAVDNAESIGAQKFANSPNSAQRKSENFASAPTPKVEMLIPEYHKGSFSCPKCGSSLKKGQKTCLCSERLDWSNYEN